MGYLTRHLEALVELPHAGRVVRVGDRFDCTDTDAAYYLNCKRAKEAPAAPPVSVPPASSESRRTTLRLPRATRPDPILTGSDEGQLVVTIEKTEDEGNTA